MTAHQKLVIAGPKLNAAQWHYDRATYFYSRHQSLLNERGLLHPKDIDRSRFFLSQFRFHTHQADYLMHRGQKVRRRVSHKVDTSKFADDFELALIQRGTWAQKAHEHTLNGELSADDPV